MQHVDEIGMLTMEVDHINPHLTGERRHQHGNLICATRHCNNKKKKKWPTPEQSAKGIRFLDPYSEEDYGKAIFEDVETGKLIGTTPAARWHIIQLDLDADHLVKARLRRTKIRTAFTVGAALSGLDPKNQAISIMKDLFKTVDEEVLSIAIPTIAPFSPPA